MTKLSESVVFGEQFLLREKCFDNFILAIFLLKLFSIRFRLDSS